MSDSNILISLSAYKEAENIVKITDKIRDQFNEIKILIVNDSSGDNTEELIKKKQDKNIPRQGSLLFFWYYSQFE